MPTGNMTSATQYVKYYDNFSGKMVTTDSTTGYGYDWQDRQTCVVNPPNAQGDITYTTGPYQETWTRSPTPSNTSPRA